MGRRHAPAAAARRLYDEDVARVHLCAVGAEQDLGAAIGPDDAVASQRAAFPAFQSVGRHAAVAGEDRRRHRLQETDPAADAVAAPPAPPTAASSPDLEALQPHRVAPFEDFRVGKPGVGHVDMHGVGPIEALARAGAAADGLVILVTGVAEGEIVDRPLGLGHGVQRAEQRVGDVLRGLDIAGHHRGGIAGPQDRRLLHPDVQRLQAAGIERDIDPAEAAEDVEHRSHAHGRRRVEIAVHLAGRAREVEHRPARVLVDGDIHRNPPALVGLDLEAAGPERVQHPAHALLGIVAHMAHIGLDGIQPEMRHHLVQLLHALLVGGDLGAEVGEVLGRVARRVARPLQHRQHLLLQEAPAAHRPHIVEQHALLLDMAAVGRHGARRDAADIGMVSAARDIEPDRAAIGREDRRDERHVRQVRAAVIGRVQHEHVARLHRPGAGADDRLHGLRHRPQMDRNMRRVGHQFAVGVEYGAGEVEPFLDVHRGSGGGQGGAHLLRR